MNELILSNQYKSRYKYYKRIQSCLIISIRIIITIKQMNEPPIEELEFKTNVRPIINNVQRTISNKEVWLAVGELKIFRRTNTIPIKANIEV